MQAPVIRFVTVGLIFLAPAPPTQARVPPPSPIALTVDVTDVAHKVFHARELIPVRPGPLTLYYAKWLPGQHAPSGPIASVSGLRLTAGGEDIPWRRDALDMYTFHLDVPVGAKILEVDLDFLSSTSGGHFTDGVSVTSHLIDFNWNQALLYPQGRASAEITLEPSMVIPGGWQFASALALAHRHGKLVQFAPVPLNTLIDSPVIVGEYFKQIDLSRGSPLAEHLNMVSDDPAALAINAEQVTHVRNLMQQAKRLFGSSHHYRHYDFLLTLSDRVPNFGLEHHQSSDDRVAEKSLIDPGRALLAATILPHELTHSWNGKFRRPAELWQPDFQRPEQTGMLWVYEGLTEYLGNVVLTTRSGMRTPQETREFLAGLADSQGHRPGSSWRSLRDTSISAQILFGSSAPWPSWRRTSGDIYTGGALLWLSVDTKLRQLSHDRRSLDDFCRIFFGIDDGSMVTKTYTFDDVVDALDQVQPYDWASYLNARLDGHSANASLEGILSSGWQVVYTDKPSNLQTIEESIGKEHDHTADIGLSVDDDGDIDDVLWGSPAYVAQLGPGMKLAAVNGRTFSQDVLSKAIAAAQGGRPLDLLIEDQGTYRTNAIEYRGGLRYPHLERNASQPDYLDEILAARANR